MLVLSVTNIENSFFQYDMLIPQRYLQTWTKIMRQTNIAVKYHFLCVRKGLIIGLKAERQL